MKVRKQKKTAHVEWKEQQKIEVMNILKWHISMASHGAHLLLFYVTLCWIHSSSAFVSTFHLFLIQYTTYLRFCSNTYKFTLIRLKHFVVPLHRFQKYAVICQAYHTHRRSCCWWHFLLLNLLFFFSFYFTHNKPACLTIWQWIRIKINQNLCIN